MPSVSTFLKKWVPNEEAALGTLAEEERARELAALKIL